MAVKPNICRTLAVTIPVDGEECQFWLIPVDKIEDVTNPTRDFAWITPDNVMYVYNGKALVAINDPNTLHVQWGHIDGDIKNQNDLWKILRDAVLSVKQNGTALAEDDSQAVDVSVPIMHLQMNGVELEPSNYTVNVDLSSYAEKTEIPKNTSELVNDSDYVTLTQVNDIVLTVDDVNQLIKTATTTMYKIKGSVNTRADLPTDPSVGDVYNISTSDDPNEVGMNVVYTESGWDNLAPLVDLSDYAKKTEINNATITFNVNGTSIGSFTVNQSNNQELNIDLSPYAQGTDVGKGNLILQKNGTRIDSFNANASEDKTIDVEMPTIYTGETADGYTDSGWKSGDVYLQLGEDTTESSLNDLNERITALENKAKTAVYHD